MESLIRTAIENKITAQMPSIVKENIVVIFEDRLFDRSYAGEDENFTIAAKCNVTVRVVISFAAGTYPDLTDLFFDLLTVPYFNVIYNDREHNINIRGLRSAPDQAKDHYEQEQLLFDTEYMIMKVTEPYEEPEQEIEEEAQIDDKELLEWFGDE